MTVAHPEVLQTNRAGSVTNGVQGRRQYTRLDGIEMMRKQQAKYACNQQPSLAEKFHLLAA
jgi:hypothetical protein